MGPRPARVCRLARTQVIRCSSSIPFQISLFPTLRPSPFSRSRPPAMNPVPPVVPVYPLSEPVAARRTVPTREASHLTVRLAGQASAPSNRPRRFNTGAAPLKLEKAAKHRCNTTGSEISRSLNPNRVFFSVRPAGDCLGELLSPRHRMDLLVNPSSARKPRSNR